jgi:sugar phosphate isomerase/epimerase
VNIVPIGEGAVPLPQIIRFLRQEGFKGFLSGEWFDSLGPPDVSLPKFVAGVRALVAYA